MSSILEGFSNLWDDQERLAGGYDVMGFAQCNRPAVKADHSESGVPSRTSPVRSPNSLVKGRSGDVPERTLDPLDFGRVDV